MAEKDEVKSRLFGRVASGTAGFLIGAVVAPFVGTYVPVLAKPLSWAGVKPLVVTTAWIDPCDGISLAESQIKAGSVGQPDRGSAFLKGQGILQQDVLTLRMRTRFTDVVVIEGWSVEAQPTSARPTWAMQTYADGCGGEGVDTTNLELDLDRSSSSVRGHADQFGKRDPTRFTVLKDSPEDVNMEISSCSQSQQVSLTVNYSVNGMSYKEQLDPIFVYAAAPSRTYQDLGNDVVRGKVELPCADGEAAPYSDSGLG